MCATLACGDALPEDVAGYASSCVRLNATPLPPYDGDPHRGFKTVYACHVDDAFVRANTRPFPNGAIVVKESVREGEDFPWLVATARKREGAWQWDEYTRNFSDEPLVRILAKQSSCTNCHDKARGADYIFTRAD